MCSLIGYRRSVLAASSNSITLFVLITGMTMAGTSAVAQQPSSGAATQDSKAPRGTSADVLVDPPIAVGLRPERPLTVAVYRSIHDNGRYYIAPIITFVPVEKTGSVAKYLKTAGSIRMSLDNVSPDVREFVATKLTRLLGRDVDPLKVGNVPLKTITVDVQDEPIRKKYKVQKFTIDDPPYQIEKLVISLPVGEDGQELVKLINEGEVTLVVTYTFDRVTVDERRVTVRWSRVLDEMQNRGLFQGGADLMSAEQLADALSGFKRKVERIFIGPVGEIPTQLLPTDNLYDLFDLGDLMKKDEEELKAVENRIYKQFDLKVDPEKFHPLLIQKKVVSWMNSERDVSTARQRYMEFYNNNKELVDVSASFDLGIFKMGEGFKGDYNNISSAKNNADDKFKEFIKKYHSVVYDDKELKYRGVKVYDLQAAKVRGQTETTDVVMQPRVSEARVTQTLTTGAKSAPVAVADKAIVMQNEPAEIAVVDNDSGEGLKIVSMTPPMGGKVEITPDGRKIKYTPNTAYIGEDSFGYKIKDTQELSAETTVSLSVVPNVLAQNDSASTKESAPVRISVLANDRGEGLKLDTVGKPQHGTVNTTGEGLVTYTPTAGYHGSDTFAYTVRDKYGRTSPGKAEVTVSPLDLTSIHVVYHTLDDDKDHLEKVEVWLMNGSNIALHRVEGYRATYRDNTDQPFDYTLDVKVPRPEIANLKFRVRKEPLGSATGAGWNASFEVSGKLEDGSPVTILQNTGRKEIGDDHDFDWTFNADGSVLRSSR